MSFQNPSDEEIRNILSNTRTIAIVGLSNKPDRPAYGVARYLKSTGYRIIPVHPRAQEVFGEKGYASLKEVPEKIDLVDIFVAADHLEPIIDDAITLKIPAIWIQEGIINEAVFEKARAHGLKTVMDRCAYKEHVRLKISS